MVIIKKAKRKNLVSITSLGILSSIAGITGTNSSAHAETLTAANTITTANSYDDDGKSNTETTDTNSNDNSKESTLTFNTVADNNASIGTNADTTVNAASPDSIATDQTADTEKNADSVTEDNSTDYANTETTANSVNTLLTSSLLQSNTTTTTANDSYIPVKSYGVDVSGYQDTDLTKYSQAGAKYTIVKLSEGTWYTNPNAQGQVNSADKLGMATYAYHFANFSDSTAEAEKEADFAIQQAQKVGIKPGTYFAIDWETEGNANVVDGNTEQNTSAILAFMRKVSAAGYKPLVYTGAYNFQNHLNVSEIIKQFPNSLWVASYKTTGEIDEPDFNYFPSMEGVAIWQFTSNWRGLHIDANVNVLPLLSNASTTDDKDKAISVNYQVVDDDNNGAVVASGTFSGKSNTSLSNRSIIDTNAPDVLNKYVLSSPDGSTLLNNDTGTITIHVTHKTEFVSETREVTASGVQDLSMPFHITPAVSFGKVYSFSRTGIKDLVTNQITWNDWSAPAKLGNDNAAINGELHALEEYPIIITADTPNMNVTITKKGMLISTDSAPHKVTNTINFVNSSDMWDFSNSFDTSMIIKATTITADDQNQTIDISSLIPEGYQLADSADSTLTSGDNGSFFNVAIVKNNADSNNTDNTDNNKNDSDSGKADSSVTNVVEFVDENSNIVGSTTIKADAAGKSFTLDSNSIPTGYQLADGASLTLTTKDNGATIQIKVVKADATDTDNGNSSGSDNSSDNGNTDNSGQGNTDPVTPGDSDNTNTSGSDSTGSSNSGSDSSNKDTGTDTSPTNPDGSVDDSGKSDTGSGSSNSDSNTDNTNNDKNDNSSSNGSDTGDSSNSGSDGSTTTPSVPDSSDNSNSNSDNGTTDNTDNANNSNSENNVNISDNTDSIDNANNVNNDTGKNSGSQTGTSDNAQAMINLDNGDVLTQEPVSTGIPSTDTSFGTQNGSDLISASSGDVNSTLATTLPQTGNSVQDTKVLKATGAVILLSEAVLSLGFAITKKKPDNQ